MTELVIAARESATDGAGGAPVFIDQAGTSVKVYVDAYMSAYNVWMNDHPVVLRRPGADLLR